MKKETYSIKISPSNAEGKVNYTAITNQGTESYYNMGKREFKVRLLDLLLEIEGEELF